MSPKQNIRKQLEADMAVFLSSGKEITKLKAEKKPGKRSPPKEKMVEIEVEHLPKALQDKYFGEWCLDKHKRKKLKEKIKRSRPTARLSIPPNKRHKSKKDYKRKNKVKVHEVED